MDSMDGDRPGILGVDSVLALLGDVTQTGQTGVEAAAASSGSKSKHDAGLRPGCSGTVEAGSGSTGSGLRPGWKGLPARKDKKSKSKPLTKQQALLDRQARAYNVSGRSRNPDYHMPLHEHRLQRQDSRGAGGWKTWSAPAVLRAGFSEEKSTCRQIASSIEGAGFVHAGGSRLVIAEAIMSGQREGLKRLEMDLSQESEPSELLYVIKNLMFDESTFELSFQDGIRASYSILGSHAQLTYRAQGSNVVHDEHIFRSPAVLCPVMNSATMHEALRGGPGGLDLALRGRVRFRATITTSDAHAANIRLLRYVDQQLDPSHLFIPNLCLQHRVGNIIEQLTKFLGNLGGNFSISKVLSKGNVLKALRQKASAIMRDRLQGLLVFDETPPAVVEEWSAAQLAAQDLVDLCMSFHEAEATRRGTHREAFQRFNNFFAGPWTGLRGMGWEV